MINKSSGRMWGIIWILPILLIMVSLCCPIEAAVYEVYLPEVSYGSVGDTVLIPVNISTVQGLESWNISIEFNPDVLEPTDTAIVDSSLTGFYTVVFSYPHPSEPSVPDKKRLNVGGMVKLDGPAPTGQGAFFYVEFDVTASEPAATDIEIVIEQDTGAPDIKAGLKGVFYAETVHYSLTPIARSYRINPGRSLTIPVKINNVEDLQKWNLDVNYPSSFLEFTGLSTTGLTDDYGDYFEYYEPTPGSVQVAGILQEALSGGTGIFLNFHFHGTGIGSGGIEFSGPIDEGNQFGSADVFTVSVKVQKPYAAKRVIFQLPFLTQIFKGPQQLPFFSQYYNTYQFQFPSLFMPPAYPGMFPSGISPYYAYPTLQYGPLLSHFPTTFLYGRYFPYGQFF